MNTLLVSGYRVTGIRYSNFWGKIACKFFLVKIDHFDPFAGTLRQPVQYKL